MSKLHLPKGFRAAGVAAGIKSSGAKDLALIVNDGPQLFGTAVFTTNKVEAAPVTWSRAVVADGVVSAVILNSGGANACTGSDGFLDTHKTAEVVAEQLDLNASDVVVCSTGLIGVRLPMTALLEGVATAAAALSANSGLAAAESIITTDSHPKTFISELAGVNIFAMAKGAGMLAPSLATMLSVVLVDAIVEDSVAQRVFADVVCRTYNRIDSDGCTSTNDTVLFMASGASGVELTEAQLHNLLMECCTNLSQQLIGDAEGHSKTVSIIVKNAASETDAVAVGRACARNNLLKCALHGEDPNWGRVLAAVGTAPADFDPYKIDVALNGVWVCRGSAPGDDRSTVDLSSKEIEIIIDLHDGIFEATIWTNDLTAMYVHENSAYAS